MSTPIKDRQRYIFLEPGDTVQEGDEMGWEDKYLDLEWIKITDPGTTLRGLAGCVRRPVKD